MYRASLWGECSKDTIAIPNCKFEDKVKIYLKEKNEWDWTRCIWVCLDTSAVLL
jgi:hypothetical protein